MFEIGSGSRSAELETRRTARHGKVDALISDLLYCAQCGERMRSTYTARQGAVMFTMLSQEESRRKLSTEAGGKCRSRSVIDGAARTDSGVSLGRDILAAFARAHHLRLSDT
jgi:hypothetical protein